MNLFSCNQSASWDAAAPCGTMVDAATTTLDGEPLDVEADAAHVRVEHLHAPAYGEPREREVHVEARVGPEQQLASVAAQAKYTRHMMDYYLALSMDRVASQERRTIAARALLPVYTCDSWLSS